MRAHAEVAGATVVDRASVLTTHLSELVREHAADLLGREDVRALLDLTKRTYPSVVEETDPGSDDGGRGAARAAGAARRAGTDP